MPTYEYACSACGHEWEQTQRIVEPPIDLCPKCAKSTAHRLISRGTNFILKGGGWYSDLYSSSKGPAKEESSSSDTAAKTESKGETKGASKSDGDGKAAAKTESPAASTSSSTTPAASPSSSPSTSSS